VSADRHATALAYLRERLDEDARLIDQYEAYMIERCANAGSYVLALPPGWQSGEPFDPDRQRAEIDVKRRIVHLHNRAHECSTYDHTGDVDSCTWVLDGYACSTLRLLALPYAGRDDFPDILRLNDGQR
jgi:hypothetical protein